MSVSVCFCWSTCIDVTNFTFPFASTPSITSAWLPCSTMVCQRFTPVFFSVSFDAVT